MAAEGKVREVVIVGAARTAHRRIPGFVVEPACSSLGAVAIQAAIERAGVKPEEVKTVFMGHVLQGGVGRHRRARRPCTPDFQDHALCDVNKVCGSGLER